jgi:hypothetical protein
VEWTNQSSEGEGGGKEEGRGGGAGALYAGAAPRFTSARVACSLIFSLDDDTSTRRISTPFRPRMMSLLASAHTTHRGRGGDGAV